MDNEKSIAAERHSFYGIYQVKKGSTIVYVGSTCLNLNELELNHRHFRAKDYSETKFRVALELDPSFKFSWALEPRKTSRAMIEVEESALIRYHKPLYNNGGSWGQYPWKASLDNNRYTREITLS